MTLREHNFVDRFCHIFVPCVFLLLPASPAAPVAQ